MDYILDYSRLKDSRNKFLTRALFVEMSTTPEIPPLFTLEEYDSNGYISFKRLYTSYNDPTEYEQAINILGSVDHWDALCSCDWFQPHLKSMRKQLALKMESEAFKAILNEGITSGKGAVRLTAYKAILKEVQDLSEESNKRKDMVKPPNRRGRPSNNELKVRLEEESKELQRLKEDNERINMSPSGSRPLH